MVCIVSEKQAGRLIRKRIAWIPARSRIGYVHSFVCSIYFVRVWLNLLNLSERSRVLEIPVAHHRRWHWLWRKAVLVIINDFNRAGHLDYYLYKP